MVVKMAKPANPNERPYLRRHNSPSRLGTPALKLIIAVLVLVLAFSGIAQAVELRQTELVPPYKSISHFDVTLDITLDQVYNRITQTASTRYYIFRIHNGRATDLNLSGITKQYFMHLVTDSTPSNYRFFQFEGYRTASEEGQTIYYTNWSSIPFTDVYIPAGQTKIFGLGFDIDRPFAQGDYNISFTFAGQEFFLDPDIAVCGSLSASGTYTLTADITDDVANCFTIDAHNVVMDLNGHIIDGDGDASGAGFYVNDYENFTLANGTVQEFNYGIQDPYATNNMLIKNVSIVNNAALGVYIYPSVGVKNFKVINTTINQAASGIDVRTSDNATFYDVTVNCTGTGTTGLTINGRFVLSNKSYYFHNTVIGNCTSQDINVQGYENTINRFFGNSTTKLYSGGSQEIFITRVAANATYTNYFYNFSFPENRAKVKFGSYDAYNYVYLVNSTGITNATVQLEDANLTDKGTVYLQWYERFNFTVNTTIAQTSNFRLNNTLNGEIVNATAAASGLSNWILVNDTKYNYSANTSYNSYTLNSHPSSPGYNMNASILSFTNTGTWNITFYLTGGGGSPTANTATLCNSTACSALGTLYYHSNALNTSGNCTGPATPAMTGYLRFYRNDTLYEQQTITNWNSGTVRYANTLIASTALIKSDTWRVGLTCNDGATNSTELNSTAYTVNNTAPTTNTPTLSDYTLLLAESVTCTVGGYADIDGDTAGTIYYRWWKNGVLVGGVTSQTVNSSSDLGATYGDKVNCSGNQSDSGYSPKNSTEKYSAQAVILSPPQVLDSNLTLLAGTAITTLYTETALNCSFYAIDNDTATGLTANVRYYDSIDGIVANKDVYNVANATVTWANQTYGAVATQLVKGRNYWCSVKIDDGSYTSSYLASEQYTVNNTAPVVGAPSIAPASLSNSSIATCTNGSYSDLDGDAINNTAPWYRWYRNGVFETGQTNQTMNLSAVNASDGDIVICEYATNDTGYDMKLSNKENSTGVVVGVPGAPTITDCSTGFYVLNYTLADEESFTGIYGTMEATFTLYNVTSGAELSNASFKIENQTYFEFCIYPYAATALVTSFQTYYAYENTSYDERNYFLLKATLNASNLQTIPIYLESDALARQSTIFLTDSSGQGKPDIYLTFQRYYPGTNEYVGIAMAKTDSQGYASTYLRAPDPFYRIIAYQADGTVLQVFGSSPIACDPGLTSCEFVLQLSAEQYGKYWSYYGKLASNCSYYNVTAPTIACTFVDTSGATSEVNFKVWQTNVTAKVLVCDETSTAATDTLTCDLTASGATGTYYYTLSANIPGASWAVLETGEYALGQTVVYGTLGLIIAALFVITMAFFGLSTNSPPVVLVLAVLGFMAAWVLGLVVVQVMAVVAIIVTVVVQLYLMRRS